MVYVVGFKQGDRLITFVVSPEGILSERSEKLMFSELPGPAKEKLAHLCSGEPDTVLKFTHPGSQPYYMFKVQKLMDEDGVERTKGNDELGNMTEVKNGEAPPPVLQTIQRLAPGFDGFVLRLGGKNAKYGTSYMIRTKDKKKFFVISPDGHLAETWDMTVKSADLPGPIRAIAERATAGGKASWIKATPAGKKPYYRFTLMGSVAGDGSVVPAARNGE